MSLAVCASAEELEVHASAEPTPYRVASRWQIGGLGGWAALAVDSKAHRLYIPRTDRVMVVDEESGKVEQEIPGLKNARGIALDDRGQYGYVADPTDGTAGFLRVFDRSTSKFIASVPTGLVPAAVVYDPLTRKVFAFNAHSHSVTIVNGTTQEVAATLPLEGRPGAAVGNDKGQIFVSLPALGKIVRIDAASVAVSASWTIAPCAGPAELAVDTKRHQLFTTCEDHTVVAVDTESGAVSAIGEAPANPGDIALDESQNRLLIADATGTVTILSRSSGGEYRVLQHLETAKGARSMIVDPMRHQGFLLTAKFGQNTAATSEEMRFRPTPVPGTFSVIVIDGQ